MSAPTRYLVGESPYGFIKAKLEYSNQNRKITLTISHKDLAKVLENSGESNLAALDLQLILEIESENNPEEVTPIILPLPEELRYMSLAELKILANDASHRG